jgi:hypothetical protein
MRPSWCSAELQRVVAVARTADLHQPLAERIGANRACVAIARKLLKRSYHVLRGVDDQALEPVIA